MTRILLIDDARGGSELFAASIAGAFGAEVLCVSEIDDIEDVLAAPPIFDLALVDLSFPRQRPRNGADALMVLMEYSPKTGCAVLTQADASVHELLRDVWDLFDLAGLVSKTATLQAQLVLIGKLIDGERPVIDPELRMFVDVARSQWRTLGIFARLVPHAGHAKVWRALFDADLAPSYAELAMETGLAVNSLRNYRAQLLPELRLHGVDDPTLRELHAFAQRCRPYLAPHVERRLG